MATLVVVRDVWPISVNVDWWCPSVIQCQESW